MKILISTLLLSVLLSSCVQTETSSEEANNSSETLVAEAAELVPEGYDAALANRLGADDYGMHQYVMAFLKSGTNKDLSAEESAELQKAHMDNIRALASSGKLVLAGPFIDDSDYRGIYIFDVKTIEEAKTLTESDPAIQAGALVMELHPWYGSAAVNEINNIHNKIQKTEI